MISPLLYSRYALTTTAKKRRRQKPDNCKRNDDDDDAHFNKLKNMELKVLSALTIFNGQTAKKVHSVVMTSSDDDL